MPRPLLDRAEAQLRAERWIDELERDRATTDLSAFAELVPLDHGLCVVSTLRPDGLTPVHGSWSIHTCMWSPPPQ